MDFVHLWPLSRPICPESSLSQNKTRKKGKKLKGWSSTAWFPWSVLQKSRIQKERNKRSHCRRSTKKENKSSRVAKVSQQGLLPPGVLAGKTAEKQKNQSNNGKKNKKNKQTKFNVIMNYFLGKNVKQMLDEIMSSFYGLKLSLHSALNLQLARWTNWNPNVYETGLKLISFGVYKSPAEDWIAPERIVMVFIIYSTGRKCVQVYEQKSFWWRLLYSSYKWNKFSVVGWRIFVTWTLCNSVV